MLILLKRSNATQQIDNTEEYDNLIFAVRNFIKVLGHSLNIVVLKWYIIEKTHSLQT